MSESSVNIELPRLDDDLKRRIARKHFGFKAGLAKVVRGSQRNYRRTPFFSGTAGRGEGFTRASSIPLVHRALTARASPYARRQNLRWRRKKHRSHPYVPHSKIRSSLR